MTNKDKAALYAELIEASARIIAFEGISDMPLPSIAHSLGSEAVDLKNGWKDFDENGEPGTQPLPIVDQVADEVFARADALRRAFAAKLAAAGELRKSDGATKH